MAVKILDAGSVLREATGLKVQDGSTLRRFLRVKVMDATSTVRTVATFVPPLSVSISSFLEAVPDPYGPETFSVVATLTATPAGGLGPYTYGWVLLSGPGWTLHDNLTATATAVSAADAVTVADLRVTVTDATGQTATADISI